MALRIDKEGLANEILNKLYLQQKEQNKIIDKLLEMKDEPKPYRSLLTYNMLSM